MTKVLEAQLFVINKYESNTSNVNKPNVSHADFTSKIKKRLNNSKRISTSLAMSSFDNSKDEGTSKSKGINDIFVSRRASEKNRSSTSFGRNHSLYKTSKHQISLIHTKIPLEQFASTKVNLEQGSLQAKPNSTVQDLEESSVAYQSTKPPPSAAQGGPPKLSKNYSLNTIFEKEKNQK